ncbi:hypothetical protein E2C01_079462 [Portunus trituberculatus]|uniref:Uncharacterized protein n=1 Tax=Portunus trituberculatus TaxID=210409 RepID=A0A5B7IQE0_PORTR|nr:hypothetical protein [Portunus trituberculatus]
MAHFAKFGTTWQPCTTPQPSLPPPPTRSPPITAPLLPRAHQPRPRPARPLRLQRQRKLL